MPFRSDWDLVPAYDASHRDGAVPGKPHGPAVLNLASNESPAGPFPEVEEAIATAAAEVNRYPDASCRLLVEALAARYGASADHLWVGAGSTQLLACAALAAGGPGSSAVFADPTFTMYRIYTAVGGAEPIPVPVDAAGCHDLDAMLTAIRDDTTVVYVCNPNNPTGTYVPATAVAEFAARVPHRVLIVVDEAYAEYATASDFASAVPLALSRDNMIVTRTFSKIYGLAGLRVGYAVGHPNTLQALRKAQVPYSVNHVAQAAALAALGCDHRLTERVSQNAVGRAHLRAQLAARKIESLPTQGNSVLMLPGG
ncbi:MAG: pyridoxal phosphate-dependent aminotransferase, partial [Acidimicrobiia bacterium]